MKRSVRFRHRWISLGLLAGAWSTFAVAALAQAPAENPLRPASKQPASKATPATPPATNRAAPPATVGTSVRTVEKRTPEIRPVPASATRDVSVVKRTAPRSSSSSAVAPAAYRRRVIQPTPDTMMGRNLNLPSSVLQGTVSVQPKPHEMIDGGMIYEDAEPMFSEYGGDGCMECGGNGCYDCCLIPCPRIPWDELTIFGGVEAFTGPKNLGQTGSFGFHQGVNWGAPLPCSNGCLAMQLGGSVTQSSLSGAEFSPETRHQAFVTGGLFRRVDCGLQYGIAYDYQSDDWYTNTNLTQLRGEVAWVFPCAHELGFWMTSSLDEDQTTAVLFTDQIPATETATWEATDLYAFFYRHRFSGWEGATGRLFAGFTGASDGLIGTDLRVPLTCDIAVEAGFTYLVPEEAKGPAAAGNEEEAWNVGISLVWYPGCKTATSRSYFAPLFNVADNGSFMVDRLR